MRAALISARAAPARGGGRGLPGVPPGGASIRRDAPYRTFSVARPIIARISEMIQKRITIWGSAQPFFS